MQIDVYVKQCGHRSQVQIDPTHYYNISCLQQSMHFLTEYGCDKKRLL